MPKFRSSAARGIRFKHQISGLELIRKLINIGDALVHIGQFIGTSEVTNGVLLGSGFLVDDIGIDSLMGTLEAH